MLKVPAKKMIGILAQYAKAKGLRFSANNLALIITTYYEYIDYITENHLN